MDISMLCLGRDVQGFCLLETETDKFYFYAVSR